MSDLEDGPESLVFGLAVAGRMLGVFHAGFEFQQLVLDIVKPVRRRSAAPFR